MTSEKEILDLEDERCAAMCGGDFAALEGMLHDELLYDRSRAAWDTIGGWRCAELDGPYISKVRQRNLVCLVVVVAQHRRSLGLLLPV